jgi:hypothetical protein
MNSRIVRKRQYHCDNSELVELSVLRYKEQEVYAFVETLMPHAIQIRQTGGPEVLAIALIRWTSSQRRQVEPIKLKIFAGLRTPRLIPSASKDNTFRVSLLEEGRLLSI